MIGLVRCGIDTVAMESTGVYWMPVVELLEQRGMTPHLVDARHVKTVPGRKSDWHDAQWLQKLHTFGLLQGSFRPEAEMCVLRTRLRHQVELIAHRAPHILHRQQALKRMNLQCSEVLADITGVTGQAIVRAIVQGERDMVRGMIAVTAPLHGDSPLGQASRRTSASNATTARPHIALGDDATIPDLAGHHKRTPGRIRNKRGVALPPLYPVIVSGSVNVTTPQLTADL